MTDFVPPVTSTRKLAGLSIWSSDTGGTSRFTAEAEKTKTT